MLALAFVSAASAFAQGSGTGAPAPADLRAGRALFIEHCAVCHGDDAQGAGAVSDALTAPPANLVERATRHDAAWFFQRMSEGWRQMHPFAHNLDEAQRRRIASYLTTLGRRWR